VVLSGIAEAKLHATANMIRGNPDHVRVLAADIAWPATEAALVAMAEREFGGLDILISNSGVFRRSHRGRLRLVSRHKRSSS
jgi:NAD(P)-dependent dehydrogenase (short-subunit alcohol dehydrogenase family)